VRANPAAVRRRWPVPLRAVYLSSSASGRASVVYSTWIRPGGGGRAPRGPLRSGSGPGPDGPEDRVSRPQERSRLVQRSTNWSS
jgi:hypothetical protein